MHDTLFIVDSGYRDLLDIAFGEPASEVFPAVMMSFAWNIGRLYGCGARNLLMPNLPDMGTAPITPEGGEANGRGLSEAYNEALALYVIGPYSVAMNLSFVNFFEFTDTMMGMPETFGFTNLTDSCITPYTTSGAFCENRDEYFWWDYLHPTKKTHALLAEYAFAHLPVPE